MVSISKRRIKKGGGIMAARRRRYQDGSWWICGGGMVNLKEDLRMYTVLGGSFFCTLFVVLSVFRVLFHDGGRLSSLIAQRKEREAIETYLGQLKQGKAHPSLQLDGVQASDMDVYNAIAMNIIETLDCLTVLNKTTIDFIYGWPDFDISRIQRVKRSAREQMLEDLEQEPQGRRRRLDEVSQDENELARDVREPDVMNDNTVVDAENDDVDYYYPSPTAVHLFCLAAMTAQQADVLGPWREQTMCDATGSVQRDLLELWSTARSEMTDVQKHLLPTLQAVIEQQRDLVGTELQLWAPPEDEGVEFMLNELNDAEKDVDKGGIYGLSANLGNNKCFVDVGSCLGLTSMAVSLLYPGTQIYSIEVAPPNWLLQEINWRCNKASLAPETSTTPSPIIILGGVGPSDTTTALRKGASSFNKQHVGAASQMAQLLWRPRATTSTRAWTPKDELLDTDLILTVKLLPWKSILSEINMDTSVHRIDVLNVDCEGCEYNLIPAMSEEEYNSISTVMGGLHWGYIPQSKKPSSERGTRTHKRLCQHENFAATSKECCAFPDLLVQASKPGEMLVQEGAGQGQQFPQQATVRDVAGELCDDFSTWRRDNHLDDISSDYGWFSISAIAQ